MRFAVLAAMAGFAFALYGWGCAFRRLFKMERGIWPVTLLLGLAVTVFLGGLLNDVALAYPISLLILVVCGAVLSIAVIGERSRSLASLSSAVRSELSTKGWQLLGCAAVIAAVLAFVVATQLPPSAYNSGDDYEKYFAHTVRMLETGTVFGSPLSCIGSETLGGQAFLDAFEVAAFPIAYINVVDAVLGLLLCLVLACHSTGGRKDLAAVSILCVLAAALIDPQYVNISTLYLGSALIMAAIALSADPRELGKAPNAPALALLYAAMTAMKPTFVLFAVVHATFVAVALAVHTRRIWTGVRWAAICAGAGAVFLSPWIVLHASNYYTALTDPVAQEPLTPTPASEVLDLLSPDKLFYGSSMLQFTIIVAVAVAGAMTTLWLARSSNGSLRMSALMTAAAGATCVLAYAVLLVVLGPLLAGYGTSVRYFAPLAIGIVPMVCGLAALHVANTGSSPLVRIMLPLALALVPVAAFLPSALTRDEQTLRFNSILAFSGLAHSPRYIEYSRQTLYGPTSENVAKLQAMVPEGEPIVAWINQPFYLDYARNPIIDVDGAGLNTPWAQMPRYGYVIWEYLGYASPIITRDPGYLAFSGRHNWIMNARDKIFALKLEDVGRSSEILSDDGHVVVFRLPQYESTPNY